VHNSLCQYKNRVRNSCAHIFSRFLTNV